MSELWMNTGAGWGLLSAAGFDDEATLHSLVEEAPQLLPLSGSPQIAIVGREVTVGSGSIDLLAIEASGRPVIIEVKLSKNAEARRAVVSQALSYAAHLYGLEASELERGALARHLAARGYETLADAARSADDAGAFTIEQITDTLSGCLRSGSFRVVLILDAAPAELVRLVGYVETVSDRISVDLVTVAGYDVGGNRILVPQRVEPDRQLEEAAATAAPIAVRPSGDLTNGSEAFRRAIADSPSEHQVDLDRLCTWAEMLESENLVTLQSFRGTTGRYTLLPRLRGATHGLVTVWNDGGPSIGLWRTVFEKRAPNSIPLVEAAISPVELGQGRIVQHVSDESLAVLTDAYREAAASLQPG